LDGVDKQAKVFDYKPMITENDFFSTTSPRQFDEYMNSVQQPDLAENPSKVVSDVNPSANPESDDEGLSRDKSLTNFEICEPTNLHQKLKLKLPR
jgi:hypothetical protein